MRQIGRRNLRRKRKRNIKKLGLATQLLTSANILIYANGEEIGWGRGGNDPVTRTVEFDPILRESSFRIRTKRVIGLFGTIKDPLRLDSGGSE